MNLLSIQASGKFRDVGKSGILMRNFSCVPSVVPNAHLWYWNRSCDICHAVFSAQSGSSSAMEGNDFSAFSSRPLTSVAKALSMFTDPTGLPDLRNNVRRQRRSSRGKARIKILDAKRTYQNQKPTALAEVFVIDSVLLEAQHPVISYQRLPFYGLYSSVLLCHLRHRRPVSCPSSSIN